MPGMILVTAAAGNQGRRLLPRLAAAGVPVRGLRASASGEAELRALGAAEVVIGDMRDSETLRRAMDGVAAVYHLCPGGQHLWEREIGRGVVDAAKAAGVHHVVYSSVLHPILTGLIQHETKRDVEEYLVESGLNFTILQPADYMQFLVHPAVFATGDLVMAWSIDTRQSVVDLADVAEVAAKVLQEGEPHYGACYELCAPGWFTGHDIAASVSSVIGRDVQIVHKSVEEFVTMLSAQHLRSVHGDPEATRGAEFQMRVLSALGAWYSTHDFLGNPNVLTWLLGRSPTTLREWVQSEYEEFRSETPAAP
jgi:uncharacterized protein YbjT (DUF2867 family)